MGHPVTDGSLWSPQKIRGSVSSGAGYGIFQGLAPGHGRGRVGTSPSLQALLSFSVGFNLNTVAEGHQGHYTSLASNNFHLTSEESNLKKQSGDNRPDPSFLPDSGDLM